MRSFRRLQFHAAFVASLAWAPRALADEAADTATARALGVEGVTLANAGRCSDAIEKLERAELLHHAPTTAVRLAECEIQLGHLVKGTERLQRVVREPLPANAHAAFAAAVAGARGLLDTTVPKLATIRIGVGAPRGTRVTLTIDGEATSNAIVDMDRRIDPGPHAIRVMAEGFLPGEESLSLAEGQTKSVRIELRADPNYKPVEAAAVLAQPAVVSKSSRLPAWIAFGIGAVGLGVGTYGAIAVRSKTNMFGNRCDANRVCPTEFQSDIRDAKTLASVSTAGFVTAGVGLAAGVALLVTARHERAEVAPAQTAWAVRPLVSPTSLGLDGTF
jgi:hypothetical protein